MPTTSSRRTVRHVVALLALLGALVVPAVAAAAVERFHNLDVEATANYTITEQCDNGSTRVLRVTVIGGHEEQSVNGETTQDEDFLTVLLRGATCDEPFVNVRATEGTADFTYSPSLQTASITGTVTGGGRVITVDMSWEGTGPMEVTNRTTTFEGFVGHFQGKERQAVATGTVVVDGETVVDGSTTNARIESLEDNNTTTGA